MLGIGTDVINGQKVAVQTRDAWVPVAYGQLTQSVPASPDVIPPLIGGTQNVSGGGHSGWSFTSVPNLPWITIAALVGAVVLLRVIHWRSILDK